MDVLKLKNKNGKLIRTASASGTMTPYSRSSKFETFADFHIDNDITLISFEFVNHIKLLGIKNFNMKP